MRSYNESQLLRIMDITQIQDFLQRVIIWLIPLIFAITVHEVAHGWVAKKCGDHTAYKLGRLTLNPIKHIDLVGTIIIPIALLLLSGGRFTFGYAKPVPVDPRNMRNPRRDMAIVAFAGPASNFIMAFLWGLILKLGIVLTHNGNEYGQLITQLGLAGMNINLVLGILNLIPIPPLDGSRIVSSFLRGSTAARYNSIERWGFFILLALIATGILGKIMWPLIAIGFQLIAMVLGIK